MRKKSLMESESICVVGNGRLGTTLAGGLVRAGFRSVTLAARRFPDEDRAHSAGLGIGISHLAETELKAFRAVFIVLPDSVVPGFAAAQEWTAGQLVLHCSGGLDRSVLGAAEEIGATTASLHPIQTFSGRWLPADLLAGITFGVEATGKAREYIAKMVERLGGRPIDVPSGLKPAYHLAAVFSSNYLVTLMSAAFALWDRIEPEQPDRAVSALLPIVRQTLENVSDQGVTQALTGPISRGDVATVEAHIRELKSYDEKLTELYQCLGLYTVEQMVANGRMERREAEPVRASLMGHGRRSHVPSKGGTE